MAYEEFDTVWIFLVEAEEGHKEYVFRAADLDEARRKIRPLVDVLGDDPEDTQFVLATAGRYLRALLDMLPARPGSTMEKAESNARARAAQAGETVNLFVA